MKKILYIHGFNSSPHSAKAVATQAYFQQHKPEFAFIAPQLINAPAQAMQQLIAIIEHDATATWYLMGSSLGGYFATYLVERYGCVAALINPAVKPYQLLAGYLGWQTNSYTNESFYIDERFVAELINLEQLTLFQEKNYFVMVQTGDEVLDYRQAVEKYANATLVVQPGGDHGFVNYQAMLPNIATFFDTITAQPA